MKLASKLLAAPLLTAVLVFGAGQINAIFLSRAASENRASFEAQKDVFRTLTSSREQLALVHASVYRTLTIIASLDEAKVKSVRDDLALQLAGVKRVTLALGDSPAADEDVKSAAEKLGVLIDKYLKQADSALDLATMDPNIGVASMQEADATFKALAAQMNAVVEHADEFATASMDASDRTSKHLAWGLGALGLLCGVLAVTASWLMQRALTAELRRAADLANEVAAGNLTIDASSQRQDEVGDLMRALAAMAAQLGRSLRTVMASSESIRTASAEIAHGNQDLSTRTEQTASNLQQAASSMDHLTGTVKHSASSAGEANRLAATAAEVAARGGEVVAQVVSTMEDINSSSRKIGDIIGVIDSIAFQTNILALNAAVEAARAGDQGRGFAVVASEVRSLAQRSAQAAREIKTLIGASVDKVEGGTRLVADAGRTMDEIVASVQKVSDIIGDISSAAAAQSSGIGEVNSSVLQLDQMTQQNAALVEQSAAAAESLKEQAVRLAEVVHTFRLGDEQPG
ncbi:hypothetical protein C1O66_21790 [Paucibacter aquatile]|uniref:Methyl-accepting chemotaxis protein n=1 Tax=Kinneretia aquatilis TaxID=2070761 RepID=A0A2N8KSA5_9BURK|nr:methyl-accepting chemotaxis protein [Paucibacter aquatile]PND36337.1 hypothetical protein C1O66_21790 [Paucibacter aquatile]